VHSPQSSVQFFRHPHHAIEGDCDRHDIIGSGNKLQYIRKDWIYLGSINYRFREKTQQYDDSSKLARWSCIYSASNLTILNCSKRLVGERLKVAFENDSS
jgi:hypothetical protein